MNKLTIRWSQEHNRFRIQEWEKNGEMWEQCGWEDAFWSWDELVKFIDEHKSHTFDFNQQAIHQFVQGCANFLVK